MNHKEILSDDLCYAKPASSIKPKPEPRQKTFSDIINDIEEFIDTQNADIQSAFSSGAIPLIREDFSIIHFQKSINSIIENEFKNKKTNTESDNILISNIFKSLQSNVNILSTLSTCDKITHLMLIKMLSYCLYSFKHYHHNYDRRRKIQTETDNG